MTLNVDQEKRQAAVTEFSEAMMKRMDAKALEGYEGWDSDYPSENLVQEIDADSQELYDVDNGEKARQLCLDIANGCMMLRRRWM